MLIYFRHSESDILVQLCLVLEKDIFIVFFIIMPLICSFSVCMSECNYMAYEVKIITLCYNDYKNEQFSLFVSEYAQCGEEKQRE